MWFCLFYFVYYSFGFSFTIIPHDALRMELLTPDYHETAVLFGHKTSCQIIGCLFHAMLSGGFAHMYPESTPAVIGFASVIFVTPVFMSFMNLCTTIKERELPPREDKPLIPSIMATFRNGACLLYLLFKVPLSVVSLI